MEIKLSMTRWRFPIGSEKFAPMEFEEPKSVPVETHEHKDSVENHIDLVHRDLDAELDISSLHYDEKVLEKLDSSQTFEINYTPPQKVPFWSRQMLINVLTTIEYGFAYLCMGLVI